MSDARKILLNLENQSTGKRTESGDSGNKFFTIFDNIKDTESIENEPVYNWVENIKDKNLYDKLNNRIPNTIKDLANYKEMERKHTEYMEMQESQKMQESNNNNLQMNDSFGTIKDKSNEEGNEEKDVSISEFEDNQEPAEDNE